ncbi:response regulator [Alteromonas sp. H39]|uniref:response regulator n=1 Tax=Alteromonas sp. H39 TaxID=3389876 RepID=UPI0039E166ED
MQYRLAIVEDNATARASLRSHILPTGLFEVSSFGSGAELKAALRTQHFEVILLDFHLGTGKNGVAWVQALRQSRFIKPSTGIIFITSDRLPQTIGQIIDVHPDLLIIKPYSISTLTRQLEHYMTYRGFVSNVLASLDKGNTKHALSQLARLAQEDVPRRLQSDVTKLQARLLYEDKQFLRAQQLYETVLTQSDQVLWAQWGRIKCQYAAGNYGACSEQLSALLNVNLAREQAFEWLACLCYEQEAYTQAEHYLDNIKPSDLSVPATRLKTLTYHKQNRVLEGIDLLQKKRAMNRSAKDAFNDFTFTLAEFYLQLAEESPETNRQESLSQARKLVGIAGRSQHDQQLTQKRDYLLAYAAVLDGDNKKAALMLDNDSMNAITRTDTPTLLVAAKVNDALGRKEKARQLMELATQRNTTIEDLSEQTVNASEILLSEQQMGLAGDKAFELNDKGTQWFLKHRFQEAMPFFYDAYRLLPAIGAFALNLLQCMVESKTVQYRRYTIRRLLAELENKEMNATNRSRFRQLRQQVQDAADRLLPPDPELAAPPEEDTDDTAASATAPAPSSQPS